jgi:hypothetical protein
VAYPLLLTYITDILNGYLLQVYSVDLNNCTTLHIFVHIYDVNGALYQSAFEIEIFNTSSHCKYFSVLRIMTLIGIHRVMIYRALDWKWKWLIYMWLEFAGRNHSIIWSGDHFVIHTTRITIFINATFYA